MNTPETPEVNTPRKVQMSRGAAIALTPVVCLVAFPVAHGIVPWAVSLTGPRLGWKHGHASGWNLCGLVPVAMGAAILFWIMIHSLQQSNRLPERMSLDWSPKFLLTGGPYAFSRHPMYLAELALWFGWVILYGSLPVLIGFVALFLMQKVMIPREEQSLEEKFGVTYQDYKQHTSCWFGRRVNKPMGLGGSGE